MNIWHEYVDHFSALSEGTTIAIIGSQSLWAFIREKTSCFAVGTYHTGVLFYFSIDIYDHK